MPGRKYEQAGSSYRYSINGQEKTPEIAANTTTAEFWQYDARIVRRWNVDPVIKIWESPYATFSNNPILLSDPNGADAGGGDEPVTTKKTNLENVTIRVKQPKEGEKKTYKGPYYDVTTYYHRASHIYGTSGGWLRRDDYLESFSKGKGYGSPGNDLRTLLATDGNTFYSLFGEGKVNQDDANIALLRLAYYLNNIGDPEEIFYEALNNSALGLAAKSREMACGRIHQSSFNVEDMTGIGLLAKHGIKTLISKFATKTTTTGRLQSFVTQAAKEVDALGDAAFTPKQLQAIQRNPNLRAMYRGNRIDVRSRQLIKNDPALSHLKSNYTRGADFVDPVTGKWWDMTTPGSWPSHVNKYGQGGKLLNTQ